MLGTQELPGLCPPLGNALQRVRCPQTTGGGQVKLQGRHQDVREDAEDAAQLYVLSPY